jgi:hypothetical protein
MRLFADSLAEMRSFAHRRTRLSPDEATAELLLAKRRVGHHATDSDRTLELVLAAAAGPATGRELAREAAAVTAFLAALPEPELARRRPRRVPVLAAAFALVAFIALCGTAEAGALPAPLQRLAHQAINAPAPSPAMRVPQPSADVRPGSGDTGSQSAPAGSGPSQESRTGKPSASPKPTHTSNSQSNGNGQPTATATASAQPTATDNGKGNGGTPGQGGNPKGHPTGNNGNGNGNSQG